MIIIGAIYLFIGKALRHVNKYEIYSSQTEISISSVSNNGINLKKYIDNNSSHSGLSNRDVQDRQQQSPHIISYSRLKMRERCQARKVVVKTLVAVVIAFFVCYAPLYLQRLLLAIITLYSNFNFELSLFSNFMAYLYVISGITFYFGSVINPILYNVISNKYRRAFYINKIMSWYHSTLITTDRRTSRIIASCKRFSRRLSTGIFRVVRRIHTSDAQLDALLSRSLQHPRSIEEIMKCTRFSKSEIRLLYRTFKQECPGGNVNEERLRGIYLQFFPQGNAIKYTRYLFSMIDRNHKGTFTFDDYILTLSVLCRGTIDEKLRWIFRFYDIHGEGHMTRTNLNEILLSLNELLGSSGHTPINEREIQQHVDEIFERIDPMHNEQITVNDFIDYCKRVGIINN
ncbi:unnamed protein product [Rotaria sp. Silwood2]|nr:unnamed protein product [Rotaria sp. Silwood2]